MKVVSVVLAVFSVLVVSCGNNEARPRVRTLTDSLQKEVLDGHDVGMAKMRKLTQLQVQAKQVMDSIQKLPAKAKQAATPYFNQLDSLSKDLHYAEYAMNRWMEEFNIDSANDNTELRVKYLRDEKEKVNKVKDAILSSLGRADSLLRK